MDLGLKGKKCLVTGGCNGLGSGITKELLKEGAKVTATTRLKDTGVDFKDKLEGELRAEFSFIQAEFSNQENIEKFISENKFEYDVLINNAGHTLNIKNPYCSSKDWSRILNLNFLSCVALVNSVHPYMKKNNWGRIINITSCAGMENSGPITFTTSKAALTAYTRSMGRVLAIESPGIVMTAIYPGVILTKGGHWDEILKNNPEHAKKYLKERCPLGRFGEIDEFSPVVAFYCSKLVSFAHGSIIGIDGGQSKHFLQYNYEP